MASNDANLHAELRALLSENRKIEAIKRYREATGAGLAAAKEAVEALERGESPPTTKPADSALEAEIVSLLEGGKKIKAIKLYREQTGTGLKEAKDAVESIVTDRHIMPSRSGCLGVVLLVTLISVAAMVFGGQQARGPAPADIPSRPKKATLVDFNYVIVFVSDMTRSVVFYRDVLGLPLRFESPKWVEFETPGTTLALHLADTASGAVISVDAIPAGQCHLGFSVEDIDVFHGEMVAKGVPCLQPPQEEDFGGRLAGYADPDGQPFWVSEASKKS